MRDQVRERHNRPTVWLAGWQTPTEWAKKNEKKNTPLLQTKKKREKQKRAHTHITKTIWWKTLTSRKVRNTEKPWAFSTPNSITPSAVTIKSNVFHSSLKYWTGPSAVSFNIASITKTNTKNCGCIAIPQHSEFSLQKREGIQQAAKRSAEKWQQKKRRQQEDKKKRMKIKLPKNSHS